MMCRIALIFLAVLTATVSGQAPITKAHVSDVIRRLENGVDEFREYLERRGDDARQASQTPRSRSRQGGRTATEDQKSAAANRKDELDDALGDLNRSTNRLRRKFDPIDTWMETRPQVDRVLDDGRRINQVVARGNYGGEVARLWAVLRTQMNDLARIYNLTPLAL